MEIGLLHTHVAVVTLFLVLLLFKTILLLAGKKELLAKVRSFKMIDPILGVLMLITGGYLLSLYGMNAPTYLWVKLIIVLLVIPIGIVAFKKENKGLAILALLLTVYVYGVSETGGLNFQQGEGTSSEIEEVVDVEINDSEINIVKGEELYLAECKKCHGVDGKKMLFKSPDLSKTQLTLAERVAWIKAGKNVMPAYAGKLSEEEIQSVAAYLDELK